MSIEIYENRHGKWCARYSVSNRGAFSLTGFSNPKELCLTLADLLNDIESVLPDQTKQNRIKWKDSHDYRNEYGTTAGTVENDLLHLLRTSSRD